MTFAYGRLECFRDNFESGPATRISMVELSPDQPPPGEPAELPAAPTQIILGELRIDLTVSVAFLNEQPLDLTAREFAVLAYLARHANRPVSRRELLREVWVDKAGGSDAQINNCLARLRQALEPDPKHPAYLFTVSNFGYVLIYQPGSSQDSHETDI
jgi:DNA-binding response OmpR family regulator